MQYEPTQLIVDALETLHQTGHSPATLPDVARQTCRLNRPLAIEVFFSQHHRDNVLTPDSTLNDLALRDSSVYKSGVYFQFKAQLYHV